MARSRMLNPINGGESITTFNFVPSSSNCQYNAGATKNQYLPQFTPPCFSEMYDPTNWALSDISQDNHGLAAQLNLQTSASVGRLWFAGTHPALLQFGFWFSNAHKFDDSWQNDFVPNGTILASQFVSPGMTNNNYYGGAYPFGPWISWEGIQRYYAANSSAFTSSTTYGGNPNNFDLIERIVSGYVMNTFNFGRFSLYAGIRFEGTQDSTLSYDGYLATPCLCAKGSNSYVSPLPSASLQIRLDNSSDVRLAYGRGISRPDPQFLTAAIQEDSSFFPTLVTIGNPALKPEHANDYDVLYERYFTPVGVIRGGFFYKDISDPIVTLLTNPAPTSSCPTAFQTAGCQISQATNAGSAYIAGVELSFEQHFTYLPGLLRGLGLLANYSYATSQATNVNPGLRNDKPALLRQAPNTWNILPSYNLGRLSVDAGFAYNGANIYAYNYTACQGTPLDSSGNCPVGTATPGGLNGPSGDVYLYPHLEIDAQAQVYLGKGLTFIFSGQNLNNEVFGFYQGSNPFFIQREYYKPTYSFGFRWDLHHE